MATTIIDVLKVDFALGGVMLLGNPEEIEAFRSVVDADAVVTDKGTPSLGKRITLGRERIVLETEIFPSIGTTIGREYPVRDDLSRLAEVVRHAIAQTNLSDQQLQGSVCRIDVIYEQDSGLPAAGYLAKRIFLPGLQTHAGWALKGGFCRIVFVEGEKQWGISIEPRFGNEETTTVFLSVSRYMNEQQLPAENGIEDSLQEVWGQAHDFLNRLDERG